jgi:prepilin-type N-terminal cleavage/methylation domain-containing protein
MMNQALPDHTARAGGFSLLELILVITIMGLLTSMAIPSLFAFKRDRDHQAAAETASNAVDYARSLAVTTGRRVRLLPERGEFKLLVEEDPMTEPGSFQERNWPMGLTGELPKGILVDQVFYPVVKDETSASEEEDDSNDPPETLTESEAERERESVLLFEPDGSTRDTFIYLAKADPSDASATINTAKPEDIYTVAIVGVIGTSVVVPRYTEELFEIYEEPGEKQP